MFQGLLFAQGTSDAKNRTKKMMIIREVFYNDLLDIKDLKFIEMLWLILGPQLTSMIY